MTPFRTLGARLTGLTTAVTLTVSLLVCIALYIAIRLSLYREVDAFLAGEIMEFRTILSTSSYDLDDVGRRIEAEIGSRQRGDLTFRLLTMDGRVVLTSHPQSDLPDPWPVPPIVTSEMVFRTELVNRRNAHVRTCSQSIQGPGDDLRIVQTAYLMDQVHASLSRFRLICAAALAVAAILAIAGGRLVARRGLRPVGAMATAARKISVENLRQRLDVAGVDDELDDLARTFNEMFERLEQQVTRLRQFTADAAHELRTPLAALRGNAEITLTSERSADELRCAIEDSIEEYDRLGRIANDLLLLARADSGQDAIRAALFRIDIAVSDVVDLYSPFADECGVCINCRTSGKITFDGDEGGIRRTIGNLLDNAIKFTPVGGRIDVSIDVAADGALELSVRDTGVGIAEEDVPHVFDRFYRADRSRRDVRAGAGLGLAICQSIVVAHGGTIALQSGARKGTVVTIQMPAQRVHAAE